MNYTTENLHEDIQLLRGLYHSAVKQRDEAYDKIHALTTELVKLREDLHMMQVEAQKRDEIHDGLVPGVYYTVTTGLDLPDPKRS